MVASVSVVKDDDNTIAATPKVKSPSRAAPKLAKPKLIDSSPGSGRPNRPPSGAKDAFERSKASAGETAIVI